MNGKSVCRINARINAYCGADILHISLKLRLSILDKLSISSDWRIGVVYLVFHPSSCTSKIVGISLYTFVPFNVVDVSGRRCLRLNLLDHRSSIIRCIDTPC